MDVADREEGANDSERAQRLESTRASWNRATHNHNRHKGDQAALLRDGGSTLFSEELELLGDLAGKRLVHVQCNSGQDSLSLARRGAEVLGVDFSDEAVAFARRLSEDSGIRARFELAEAVSWMASTDERFDVAFASYGVTGWIEDLQAWADGVARILRPGGRFVYVEFHPLCWSLDADLNLRGDDYFQKKPFVEPVGDYVAESEAGLGGSGELTPGENDIPATSWQHTLGDLVTAFSRAGLQIERLREYPYSNGCRLHAGLVWGEDRRWRFPEGVARVPLMFGLACAKPA